MKITNLNTAARLENPMGLDARVAASTKEAELVQFTLQPGESIPLHPMTVRVFFIVLEGRGKITVDDEIQTVGVNDVVEIEPGLMRGWEAIGHSPLRVAAVKTPRPAN